MTNREKFLATFKPGDSPSRVANELGLNRGSCIRWAKERAIQHAASTTLYDAEGNIKLQWVREKADDTAFQEYLDGLVAGIEPADPVDPRDHMDEGLCACYIVPDTHIGMLAWPCETGSEPYDLEKARSRLRTAVTTLSAASRAGQALVVFLGDFLHFDSFDTVTPMHKNQLDSDTRYPKLAHESALLMRFVIDKALLAHGDVHVIIEEGNHDPVGAVWLREVMQMYYSREPRVEIDMSPRKFHYYRFGATLIGTHHGHLVKKPQDLPLIMANDKPMQWGSTDYRVWWTGHVHKQQRWHFAGCDVESFETVAPPDAWADSMGYRPKQSMTMIVLHKEEGEWARHTVRVVDKH